MAKITLDNVTGGQDLSQININFQDIEDELNDKVLYRDNPLGEPNTMETILDMNGHSIINLPQPVRPSDPARLQDVQNAVADPTSAVLTTFVPYGVLEAQNVQHAIQEIHDLIPGISEATPSIEALTVRMDLVEDDIEAIQDDVAALQTQIAGVAVDTNLVHKTGAETIYGVKTFGSSPIVPTPQASESSTVTANTAWTKANFVKNTGNETIYGTKTFASPPIGIQLPSTYGAVGTYAVAYYTETIPNSNTATYYPGTDIAGASLRIASFNDAKGGLRSGIPATTAWNMGGTSLSGTWRLMSTITNYYSDDGYWGAGLFLRIA